MKVTGELFDKLAGLSKLEFDEASKAVILRDLEEMITFVEHLKEVDTAGVEPLLHVTEQQNRLREDVVKTEISREEALQNAPLHDGTHFKVPKVIKKPE